MASSREADSLTIGADHGRRQAELEELAGSASQCGLHRVAHLTVHIPDVIQQHERLAP